MSIAGLVGASDEPWIDILRPGPPAQQGRCVLFWVQRAKRATANRAANVAVRIADRIGLPVIAAFVLVPDYPSATLRAYRFMAEGLRELPDAFRERGIGWALRVGDPVAEIPRLVGDLGATAVVTDHDPLRIGRRWREAIARDLTVPFLTVASDTIAPPGLFPKAEFAAHTLRPKLWRAISGGNYLDVLPDPAPRVRNALSRLNDGPDPLEVLDTLPIDRSVPPSPRFRGGRAEALRRLDRFLDERLERYPENRGRPETDSQSELSPYLHYGQIGPLEVARAAIARRVGDRAWLAPKGLATIGGGNGDAIDDLPLVTFLDELITQRELAVNFALRNTAYDDWEGLPEWGRATLDKHRDDRRPTLYPPARIEAGETGDRLWNAAQRQMLAEGWMHNRLRMYWAKQLLFWTADPEEAFALAVRLNDRFFLDGRDSNGYAGVAWSIGGRHDRPFPPDKPILGLVRPMTARGMARKFDTEAYISMIELDALPARSSQVRLTGM
jgi:deoxyribodipyrimidine photo-lyase